MNGDGKVSWEDFTDYLKRLQTTNNWQENDAKWTNARDCLKEVWDGLRKQADDNMDQEVSLEEWLTMWESCINDVSAGSPPTWLTKYGDMMFHAADTSGDGEVDKDEFHVAYKEYGLDAANTEQAFNLITENGAVALNSETYSKLWNDFFSNPDVGSKGSSLFGILPSE